MGRNWEPSDAERERRRRTQAAYRKSGKHHEAIRRYRQTAKGKASIKRSNDKQLRIGGTHYVGYCTDAERAQAINAHIRQRLREFTCHSAETADRSGSGKP